MKIFSIVLATVSFVSCTAQTPTKADIEKAVLSSWDKPASTSGPKQAATIHSIKIGSGATANVQDKIDGIPDKATVTVAQIDFTVREYYNDQTIATHRVMTAKVYKDQFAEWALKSNGMKTIETKFEPSK